MFKVKNFLMASFLLSTLISTPAFSEANNNETVTEIKKEVKYSVGDFVQTYKYKNGTGETNWTANLIMAEGWGSPPNKPDMSLSQKKNQAYTAALVMARRNLLITLEGVHITSKTTVKDAITEEDIIKEELTGFIKNSQVIKGPTFDEDGTAKVTVAVKIFGKKNSVAGIIIPLVKDNIPVMPTPISTPEPVVIATPTPTPSIMVTPTPTIVPEVKTESKEENYTGVIIDCTGLGAEAAMSPVIFDQAGEELYIGKKPVNPDMVISEGIIKYHKTMASAKSHESAGKNPLVIKALAIKGNLKSDIVLSNEDSQKLLKADKKEKFLEKLNVAMVL